MSTPYFALYPTDFLADVGHLGNTELGVYWRLLLVYYRDGKPLPFDTDKLRRLAMSFSPEECRVVDTVVAEFFVLTAEEDGSRTWRHKRADREIAAAHERHAKATMKATLAAKARWAGNAHAPSIPEAIPVAVPEAMLQLCHPEPEPEPSISPTVKPAPKGARAGGIDLLLQAGVSQQVADDWVTVRKGKRLKVVTKTEVEELLRQAQTAKLTAHQAVEAAVQRGWGGFRASWLANEGLDRFGKPAPAPASSDDRCAETKAYLKSMEQTPEERAASAEARKRAMAAIKVAK